MPADESCPPSVDFIAYTWAARHARGLKSLITLSLRGPARTVDSVLRPSQLPTARTSDGQENRREEDSQSEAGQGQRQALIQALTCA